MGPGFASRAQPAMEMNTRYRDSCSATSYSAQIGASDLAFRIQARCGRRLKDEDTRSLGTPQNRLSAGGTRGTISVWWPSANGRLLPDETFNATPPGGALVFELHRRKDREEFRRGERSLRPDARPASAFCDPYGRRTGGNSPRLIPGCSGADRTIRAPSTAFSEAVARDR